MIQEVAPFSSRQACCCSQLKLIAGGGSSRKKDNAHIVSTVATVVERYRKGKLENKPLRLPPLEENIVYYLINLSREYDLVEEKKVIEELRNSIFRICERVTC